MHIERNNATTQDDAVRLIDSFLEQLQRRQLPGDFVITGRQKKWTGSRMDFSFRAGSGFLTAPAAGMIDVTEKTVILDPQLPRMVTSFVAEQYIYHHYCPVKS